MGAEGPLLQLTPFESSSSSSATQQATADALSMDEGATKHSVELARSGRSACKKCKLTIDNKALAVVRRLTNGREMTHWYHAECWPIPKKNFGTLDELHGWETLAEEHRRILIARAPAKAPTTSGLSTSSSASALQMPAATSAPSSSTTTTAATEGALAPSIAPIVAAAHAVGGTFRAFVALTERVEREGSSLEKSAIIARHFARIPSADDRYVTARFLLPAKKDHDLRTYNLKDKSLLPLLAGIFRCSQDSMAAHLVESSDIGLTAETFYAASRIAPAAAPEPPITLSEVSTFLDKLAEPSAPSGTLLGALVPRTTPSELRVLIRIVRKDVRINAGSAVVLKGIVGEAAYQRFKAQPQELRAICDEAARTASAAALTFPAANGAATSNGAAASSASSSKPRGSGLIVGQAFKPQLAGQAASFDAPVTKYPAGFFCEVKYDGERLMAHLLSDRSLVFFSRAGKPVVDSKVSGVAEALRRALPAPTCSAILDGEVDAPRRRHSPSVRLAGRAQAEGARGRRDVLPPRLRPPHGRRRRPDAGPAP